MHQERSFSGQIMRQARLDQAFRLAVQQLSELRVDFALVGGLAVSSRTEPRLTRDIDLAVAVKDDSQSEKIIFGMRHAGYRAEQILEQTGTGRLATVRLLREDEKRIFIDLLFASSGIEEEIVKNAEILKVLGLSVKVATTGHLLATKILSQSSERQQDRDDIVKLLKVAGEKDLRVARDSLRLIVERGFHRRKNLLKTFKLFLHRHTRAKKRPL